MVSLSVRESWLKKRKKILGHMLWHHSVRNGIQHVGYHISRSVMYRALKLFIIASSRKEEKKKEKKPPSLSVKAEEEMSSHCILISLVVHRCRQFILKMNNAFSWKRYWRYCYKKHNRRLQDSLRKLWVRKWFCEVVPTPGTPSVRKVWLHEQVWKNMKGWGSGGTVCYNSISSFSL